MGLVTGESEMPETGMVGLAASRRTSERERSMLRTAIAKSRAASAMAQVGRETEEAIENDARRREIFPMSAASLFVAVPTTSQDVNAKGLDLVALPFAVLSDGPGGVHGAGLKTKVMSSTGEINIGRQAP